MRQLSSDTFEVDVPPIPDFFNHRPLNSHKGTFGHALLVAGSYGKMGAAVLAARACLRAGVGLLTVHVPRCGVDIMQTAVPEAMVSVDESETHWTHCFAPDELERFQAVGVGPGVGTDSQQPFSALLAAAHPLPMVLDADGLNMLALMDSPQALMQRCAALAPLILTPHAKEFERLFGCFEDEGQRQQAQRRLSQETGMVVVYKGYRTQITGSNGDMYINTTGNPGMSTAGSGDVLTGIILSILAQNRLNQIDAAMCAVLGVWLHGKSADFAVQNQSQCSLLASDIVENLRYVTI